MSFQWMATVPESHSVRSDCALLVSYTIDPLVLLIPPLLITLFPFLQILPSPRHVLLVPEVLQRVSVIIVLYDILILSFHR
jgi:hypothetical protein